MPQKWLYDPIDNLMAAFSTLTSFQALMDADDADAALARCVFLQTEWDANGNETVVLPGAIFGIHDGLTRRRGNSSQFATSGIELWAILQAAVPADYSDTHATPARWFCNQLQSVIDELEVLTLTCAPGALDITTIEVSKYPLQSRVELQEGDVLDYWWAALDIKVGR